MYLIKAIPIARGIGSPQLSYWSSRSVEPNSIIKVPLRKRIISAMVVSSEPAAGSKSEIRKADFVVKKISNIKPKTIVFECFLKTAEKIADYYASSTGAVLFELLPMIIVSEYEKLPTIDQLIKRQYPRESYVLQKNDEDRFAYYKSLIRERFARRESVFMIMPTIEDIKKACLYFEKGVEPYTYIFHGGLAKKEIVKRWKAALADDHPIVVVATGSFLSLPRPDLGIIIVERENARSYKSQRRPFIDFRHAAFIYAKEIGADFMAGDSCLRIETLYRRDQGELVEYAPLSMRSLSTAIDEAVDMKHYKNSEKRTRVLSDELISLAKKNKTENGLLFVFALRRGLAPQTICSDCQNTVCCDHCSSPLVLYGERNNRFFLCNKCGRKFDANFKCKTCGGWRLVSLGIGTEKVEQELRENVPETKIWRLDKISAPNHKKALDIVDRWYASPGSILVGTELALLYLDKSIDFGAVASLDALFSIPDFRINEKVFSIILKIRSIAQKQFLLQTRLLLIPVLMWGVKGNIMDFYRFEIENRRRFLFPPFATFIKISVTGKKENVLRDIEKLKTTLTDFTFEIFPAFVVTIKGNFVMHALIKLRPGEWINNNLLGLLRSLPPQYAVNVDPESIL